ncbi:MAG: PhoD-like phosphatase [Cyanobacteria bacterium J06649_4]
MDYLSQETLLGGLPLILAGPMLRRTSACEVTVWLALKQACQVELSILETSNQGKQLGQCCFKGMRETVALGQALHVVAVTARASTESLPTHTTSLLPDRLYAYDLHITPTDDPSQTYDLASATDSGQTQSKSISYFAHQKPTFALPPTHLDQLKIVHGSCRKPHGRGFDALPILDSLLERNAAQPQQRPHQLFLTGDQIYGDDVADPLLWLATSLGNALLGWKEELPTQTAADKLPAHLPAGTRAPTATQKAGLTAGLTNKEERTTSHLFSFGEYCAIYLLGHSPTCWPERLPDGQEIAKGWKTIRRWNHDKRNMEQFLHSLWKVRRLLANIPTYTIFDDHDVSDDWNLNQDWCLRVLGKPLGRRVVKNAMLAYATFQAWGNTPEQFEPDRAGAALLDAAQRWSRAAGNDADAEAEMSAYLGMPDNNPHTALPEFIQDKSVLILQRNEQAIAWHYTIRSACHEVVVLDTRTWRGYPTDRDTLAPPMLMSPTAFQRQLTAPLSQQPPTDRPYATFVVAPTNVFGMRVLDWIQQWHLEKGKVFTADVGDSWNFHDEGLATLLTTLFQHRQNVVVLSGDIHYSSAINVDYENLQSGVKANLVQLTSSAIKNEEMLTQLLHTRLKQWLLPERPRHWIGWSHPPDMQEKPPHSPIPVHASAHPPDWTCEMRWLKRQRAQIVDTIHPISELIPPSDRVKLTWAQRLKFWRSRWLQEGQDVVGVNNIALVEVSLEERLQQNDQDSENSKQSVEALPKMTVEQSHYWFSPWAPTQVVCSRFK